VENIVLSYYYRGCGDHYEKPSSYVTLVQRLDELIREYNPRVGIPFSVDLMKDNGYLAIDPSTAERLSVGLGDGEWILLYFPGETGGKFQASLGDPDAEGKVAFFFGDWTELSRKHLVPRQQALEVVRVWFEEGVLSSVIEWSDETL
jgi:hypothetical protein